MITGSREYVLNSSNLIMILTVVYKSCHHWSVHISLNSFLWVVPHSSQPPCILLPQPMETFWGLAEQGRSGFQLMWIILRVVSASAQNRKWKLWSSWNEALSRGFSLKGKGKPTKLDPCHLIVINTLNCTWKQRLSWYKWWKGMAEHLSHNCISACLKCRAEELLIDTAEARAKRDSEKFNGMGLSPNQKILLCHYMFLRL